MTKSLIVLASLSLTVLVACLASTAGAQGCSACGAEENWGASAASFLGGKSIEETPAPQWGPGVERLTNSQFNSNETKNTTSNNSDKSVAPIKTPAPVIDLKNATAEPNPVSPGSPVKITAILGEDMAAYAIIKNSVDVRVGNVTLEHVSGGEYAGTWTADIATGVYRADIVASASGTSRTFNNALQIEVKDLNATSGSTSTRTFKKLG